MHDLITGRPPTRFLSIPAAAARVGRSTFTVHRWIRTGRLLAAGGLVREDDLLLAERDARRARNTPRGATLHRARDMDPDRDTPE